MISQDTRPFKPRALIVDDDLGKARHQLSGGSPKVLARSLEERDVDVVRALSFEDGQAVVVSDASIQAVC